MKGCEISPSRQDLGVHHSGFVAYGILNSLLVGLVSLWSAVYSMKAYSPSLCGLLGPVVDLTIGASQNYPNWWAVLRLLADCARLFYLVPCWRL